MAAMLVFGGCGNKTADRVTENQTHKTENESNEPVEKEPAEDEDELKEENQEEQNTQDQETDVEEEEEKAEIPEERMTSKIRPLFEKEAYCQMVEKAKRYIYEGDIFQVVLSNRLEADF